jgi:hypothetical protein
MSIFLITDVCTVINERVHITYTDHDNPSIHHCTTNLLYPYPHLYLLHITCIHNHLLIIYMYEHNLPLYMCVCVLVGMHTQHTVSVVVRESRTTNNSSRRMHALDRQALHVQLPCWCKYKLLGGYICTHQLNSH